MEKKKWQEIADAALEALKKGAMNVVEETKQEFITNFITAGIPFVEGYAAEFVAEVKKQAENETGWCKIRDSVVIPGAVQLVLFIGKRLVETVAEKAKKEAATA